MSPEERQLLTALFDRVRTASSTPRDRDAEMLIEQATKEQPYAAYYLSQAVIIQEKGLEAAADRIKELEERVRTLEEGADNRQPAAQSGGFLSGIFGSSQQPQQSPASGPWGARPQQQQQQMLPYDDGYRAPPPSAGYGGPWGGQQQQAAPSAGGSFLRGALGTAAGVAGGMLLANSLSGIFGGHSAANALGLGGTETVAAPVEETIINNNYFGDDAVREASDNNPADNAPSNDGWQQADYGGDDQSDFGSSFDDDDSMNV